MFNIFKKVPKEPFLKTDIHSHLLPAIDDGVKTFEESAGIINSLYKLGINKIITTPHVMSGYYENTPEIINGKLVQLIEFIKQNLNIEIELEAAAEYYVDEHFYQYVIDKGELLSFGDNFILIETSFLNKPILLKELIFSLQSRGYKPVLAHPERYVYLQDNYELLNELLALNVLLQVNVNALTGYYSPMAKKLAQYIIKNEKISFLGSDIHNQKHLMVYQKAIESKYFQKCRQLPILNNSL